jgi:hypothetical protein
MQPRRIIEAFVVVLLAACSLILYPPLRHHTYLGGYESLSLARSLAGGNGFANPFAFLATGPSAHLAPLFPALMAFVFSHSSSDQAALNAMELLATLIVVLQVCVLPFLARYLGLGFYTGVGASVLWLVARLPKEAFWEQNSTGLLIAVLAFPMVAALRRRLSMVEVALCAVLWGVLLLLCPAVLPALGAWLVLVVFARKQKLTQKLVLVLVPLLMLVPWTVRNYRAFHHFVFVRDNMGMEMEVSNNPCATFSFQLNVLSGCYSLHHPNENFEEVFHVAKLGEVGYNQERMGVAKEWIKSNPREFATLTAERFTAFWLPSVLRPEQRPIPPGIIYSPFRDVVVTIASLVAVGGLVLLWRINRSACLVLLVWLVTYPPIYYITQYSERVRIPVQWAILLPACYAVSELWKRLAGGTQTPVNGAGA